MKDRIKEFRKSLGLNQSAFAEKLHLAPNYISLIESGKNPPSDKFIYKICDAFKVNEDWLRTGNGEMYRPLDREEEIAEITAQMFKEDDPFRLKLHKLLSKMNAEQLEALKDFVKQLSESLE